MTHLIERISSFALIFFTATLLYVAVGAFNRFDRIEAMVDNSEKILLNVDKTLNKLIANKDLIPTTVRDTSKGFLDGIRDSLNKEPK